MQRSILLAMAIIMLAACGAHAQQGMSQRMGKGTQRVSEPQKAEVLEKKKAAEQAYKDALQKIPEAKEKPDPWRTMR